MSKDRIKVIGPWLAWGDHVRRGQMVRPDGASAFVLLRSHPEADAGQYLRKDGRLLAALSDPRILGLLHITKASGHPLWVYEGFDAVSMDRVLQVLGAQGEYLPIRTCLGLVANAAQGVGTGLSTKLGEPAGDAPAPTVFHPGVAPSEVLLDAAGQLKVAGFRVCRGGAIHDSGASGYCAPVDNGAVANAVYGLGALLVHLLSGEAPAAGSEDPERHGAIVRRALIRVLARPGEAVGDSVIALIRNCLSLDLAERPDLDGLVSSLQTLSEGVDDADLEAWAPVKISPILQQQEAGYPSEEETRQRRYVDATSLHSDEPSSETPPVRRPPREVPTILAKPGDGLSLAVGRAQSSKVDAAPTGETDAARVAHGLMPSMDDSISLPLPLPDALIAPSGVASVDIDPGGGVAPSGVQLDIQSDEWNDLDSPTQAKRASGWIMAGGVFGGMLLATLVVWVAMDRLAGRSLRTPSLFTGAPQEQPMQTGASADEMATTPPEAPASPAVPETPPLEAGAPEAPTAAPVTPEPAATEAPPAVVPPPTEAVPPPPEEAPEKKSSRREKPPEKTPDRFAVTFKNADPSVTRMVVRCHIGKGSGTSQVRLGSAGRGPCKVIGYRGAADKLIVSAVLTGPRRFTCFKNGSRTCE